MNYRVRIIKRGRDEGRQSLSPGRDEKTTRQSEREIAGTVKGWIAEWEERRRLDGLRAFALVK
jgi:predicted phage gp36 major capsid-like protein